MWLLRRIATTGCLAALILGGVFAAEEENPQPPEDFAYKARIEQWVKDLGSDDFRVREKATVKLLEAGDDAAFALRAAVEGGAADLEVMERAGRLLQQIAWVPPEIRKEIDRLIETLKASREREEWKKAWEQLRRIGDRGEKAFEKATRPPENPKAVLELESIETEGAVSGFRVLLRNAGEKGFWIAPVGLHVEEDFIPYVEKQGELGNLGEAVKTIREAARRFPGGAGVFGVGELDELPPYLYLSPGKTYESKRTLSRGTFGKAVVHGRYQAPERSVLQGNPRVRIMIRQLENGREGGQFRFAGQVDAGIAPEWPELQLPELNLEKKAEFHVLPNLYSEKEVPAVSGLRMILLSGGSGKADEADEKADELTVSVRFVNKSEGKVQVPDLSQAARPQVWYLWLDAKGDFLTGGSLSPADGSEPGPENQPQKEEQVQEGRQKKEERVQDQPADRWSWIPIAPSESTDFTLSVPVPVQKKSGVRLVLGMEVAEIPPEYRGFLELTRADPQALKNLRRQFGIPKVPENGWTGLIHSNALILPEKD